MELLKIHHEHFFSKRLRIDGRKFNEFRDCLINMDSVSSVDSSTTVKVGSTAVMCGIRVTINEDIKALECVNYGDLIDLKVSLHSLDEDNGERDEITSLLMKLIKGNVLFDHKPLISESEDGERQYLTLNIELVCLNNDGNVFDAFIIAFLAGINSLRLPEYKDLNESFSNNPNSCLLSPSDKENVRLKQLKIFKFPISVSSALLPDGKILIDPNRDEEKLATGSITIVFDLTGDSILMIEKKGGTPMEEINLIKHLTSTKSMATKFFQTTPLFHSKYDETMDQQ